jgi:hypothetical protein
MAKGPGWLARFEPKEDWRGDVLLPLQPALAKAVDRTVLLEQSQYFPRLGAHALRLNRNKPGQNRK